MAIINGEKAVLPSLEEIAGHPFREETPQHVMVENKQIIPLSYVLWLTMRSRFIDELGKKDPEILELWQQYEDQQMEIVTKEMEVVK